MAKNFKLAVVAIVVSAISSSMLTATLVKPKWQEMIFTLEVTENERLDIGSSGHSHGDIDVVRGDLIVSGKKIGSLTSLRQVIDINEADGSIEEDRMATSVVELDGGTINLQMLYSGIYGKPTAGHDEVVITGGTGKYVGIRGEASWILNADGHRDMKLHYSLD